MKVTVHFLSSVCMKDLFTCCCEMHGTLLQILNLKTLLFTEKNMFFRGFIVDVFVSWSSVKLPHIIWSQMEPLLHFLWVLHFRKTLSINTTIKNPRFWILKCEHTLHSKHVSNWVKNMTDFFQMKFFQCSEILCSFISKKESFCSVCRTQMSQVSWGLMLGSD